MGEKAHATAIHAAKTLRAAGFRVELPPVEQKFGKALGQADRIGARYALILGEDEVASGPVDAEDAGRRHAGEIYRSGIAGVFDEGKSGVILSEAKDLNLRSAQAYQRLRYFVHAHRVPSGRQVRIIVRNETSCWTFSAI